MTSGGGARISRASKGSTTPWQRRALALDARELALTRGSLRATGVSMGVALLSIAVAARGGPGAWAGLTYVVLGPAMALNGAITGRRVRRLRAEEQAPTGAEGPVPAGAEEPGTT